MLFETTLSGHRMEYIHHLYMGMVEHPEDDFVIVVPKEFEQKKGLYQWPEAANVRFVYMTETVQDEGGIGIAESFHETRILRKYVKQEKAESVFLISMVRFLLALPFLIPGKVKVSGIIYNIYLYTWKESSWIRRIQDIVKHLVMRFTPCLKTVFVLNDEEAVARLNQLYQTKKFRFVPDPYQAPDYQPRNIKKELGVGEGDLLFLHFGGMARRKGTLEILQAITLLPPERRKHCVFVFAGRVTREIKEEFFGLKASLPADARVLVYDQFCTNEFLADLCLSCDVILVPYRETNCSSGLLGHAAYYGTPVIGPSDGLIGTLIRRYRLGKTLDAVTAESIAQAIGEEVPFRIESEYKEKVNRQSFIDAVFRE